MTRIIRRLWRDRRAVSALIVAVSLVPMVMASGAAVDYSRVSAARAQLQSAADSAALAGAGAYGNAIATGGAAAQAQTQAQAAATAAFNAGAAGVKGIVSLAGGTPKVVPTASGSTYAVEVSGSATMQDSLLAAFVPSVTMAIDAKAAVTLQAPQITAKNVPWSSPHFSAYDRNALYLYQPPVDSQGNPEYSNRPQATNQCNGPIATTVPGPCPYFLIGDTANPNYNPAGASLSYSAAQPIAFAMVNITGADTSYGQQSNGCPYTNSYGSLSQLAGGGVPLADSTNIFTSAFEALGESPSYSSTANDESSMASPADPGGVGVPYGTNHALSDFEPVPYQNEQQGWNIVPVQVTTHCAGPNVSGANATHYPPNAFYEADTNPHITGPAATWAQGTEQILTGGQTCTGSRRHQTCTPATATITPPHGAPYSNCSLMIEDIGTHTTLPYKWTAAYNSNGSVSSITPDYNAADATTDDTGAIQYLPPVAGQCFDPKLTDTTSFNFNLENPKLGSQTCAQYGADNYAIYWNDMGGEGDDLDYNDFEIVFTCGSLASPTASNGASTFASLPTLIR